MKQNRLIAFNTLAGYGQSLVGLFVGLFSARWVLESLGQTDFGLFGVVGSLIMLLTFLNGGLSVGVARFYAFAIGRVASGNASEGVEELKRWFNTALSTHLSLGVLILILGWPIGEFAIRQWLNIPPDRMEACVTVFHVSIFAGFFTVVGVPFTAMFVAQQRIAELALFGIAQSLLILGLAWLLLTAEGDRLIFYGVGMSGISITIILLQTLRASIRFPACRACLNQFFHKRYFTQLFSFVGWKMFGMSCVAFRDQGVPIMTNLMFGPLINAAYSVANRLSIQANALSSSLLGAFQPAITAAEGMGDRQKMVGMCLRVCRIGTLLSLVFVVPIMLEMETLLNLWLQTPPQYAAEIGRWLLGLLIVDRMTAGPMMAVNAVGKIAIYEIIQGPILLLALPILWILVNVKLGPISIGIALFLSTFIYCVARLVLARKLTSFPIRPWLQTVGAPAVLTVLAAFSIGLGSVFLFDASLWRMLLTTGVSALVVLGFGIIFLVNKGERSLLFEVTAKKTGSFKQQDAK